MAWFGKKKKADDTPAAAPTPPPADPTPAPPADLTPQEFGQQYIIAMPIEIAQTMIYDWADHHGGSNPDTLSATIHIDELGRVARIEQPMANGVPYVPSMEAIGQLNGILAPFGFAPPLAKATTFAFTFDHGEFDGQFTYPS